MNSKRTIVNFVHRSPVSNVMHMIPLRITSVVLINIKYESILKKQINDDCHLSVQKTTTLVETKQNEEKQELLDQIERERQTLVNEVESKHLYKYHSMNTHIRIIRSLIVYENQVLTLENQLSDHQQLLKQLKTYKVNSKFDFNRSEFFRSIGQ